MRKYRIAVIILCILSIIAVACRGSGHLSPANEAAKDEITLKMMHLWPEETNPAQYYAIQRIVNEYSQHHPHITFAIEVLENDLYKQKLKVLSTSNEQPDIGFSWAAGFLEPYINGQRFAPLDDLLKSELKDMFVPGTTMPFAKDGKTYALPFELHLVPIYYNNAIFKKYGLTPPETLDDLKEIITTLNKFGITPIALGGKDAWTSSFWYMYLADRIGGAHLLDEAVASSSFEHPALIEAARMIQELVEMNAFQEGFNGLAYDESKADFMAGKAAMYATGTWEVPNFTTNPDVPQEFKDNVGYFKFPVIEGGKGESGNWVGGVGVGMFVSEKSKHKDEAKQFVAFFMKRWGQISVSDVGIIPGTKVDPASIAMPQLFIDLLNELYNANKITLYLDVQMKPVAAVEHQNLVQALFGTVITPEEFVQLQDEFMRAGK